MTLTDLQLSHLRAADDLAGADEVARLVAAGIDPADGRWLRSLVAESLADPLPPPELAGAVLAALGLEADEVGPALRRALVGGRAPDLAPSVMAALDLDDGLALRDALRDALAPDHAEPDIADDVMTALGLDGEHGSLRDVLRGDPGTQPELATHVLGMVGLSDESSRVRALMREEVAAAVADAGDIASAVLEALGLLSPEQDARLQDALRDPEGEPDDLWAAISADLGLIEQALPEQALPEAPAAESDDNVVDLRPSAWWRLPAVALVAAATLLLFVTGAPTFQDPSTLAFEMSDVNHVEIEDLSTDSEAVVQVFQFDEDAPPIIFIDIIDEPLDGAGSGGEGTTL